MQYFVRTVLSFKGLFKDKFLLLKSQPIYLIPERFISPKKVFSFFYMDIVYLHIRYYLYILFFVGGFLLDLSLRCEGLMHLLMTFVLALLFLLHTGLAFSSSLPSLAVCSTAMEFAMGMVDTGTKDKAIILLQLQAGVYFP